jgi:hypothetical protein
MLDSSWGVFFLPFFLILPIALYLVVSWYRKLLKKTFGKSEDETDAVPESVPN